MKRIYCYITEDGLYKASTLESLSRKIQNTVNYSITSAGKLVWHGCCVYPCYSADDDFTENPVVRVISVNPVTYNVQFLKPRKL